jgi:hypothetical protein
MRLILAISSLWQAVQQTAPTDNTDKWIVGIGAPVGVIGALVLAIKILYNDKKEAEKGRLECEQARAKEAQIHVDDLKKLLEEEKER